MVLPKLLSNTVMDIVGLWKQSLPVGIRKVDTDDGIVVAFITNQG